jgi:lysylphosphatidylglycerol synthetase-like protein (DUF2156 family)
MALYRLLADFVVVVHLAYVAVVVIGMALILAGIARGWAWVRNFWFCAIHFAMIAVVAAESLAGLACPLTTWEFQLRMAGGGRGEAGSFVGRLVHALMFFGVPRWAFTVSYCLFALAVVATLILAPPRRPGRKGPRASCP